MVTTPPVAAPGEEVPEPSTIKPMTLCPISFDCNVNKYVLATYQAQFDGQAASLNVISITDWLKNRAAYDDVGRGSGVPQDEVRELYRKDLEARRPKKTKQEIEEEMERLAALHERDLIAGGFNMIAKLGSRYSNSSIGSQWKRKIVTLQSAVDGLPKKDKPKLRINVKLKATSYAP